MNSASKVYKKILNDDFSYVSAYIYILCFNFLIIYVQMTLMRNYIEVFKSSLYIYKIIQLIH